ncbi:uncharacterized protein EMH_0094470 [Eimeria mitis]|uniref:Uncharacterized protein n=1 Tax=Eimeria mitis TaxID=44415 RepID=U6KAE1_9EIME|nr:uncharacterized protein EMH_0094470 [Eimeria mitis]CDJ34990.1 hypothetical protein EMH_0094470 [Eimeria mitis]
MCRTTKKMMQFKCPTSQSSRSSREKRFARQRDTPSSTFRLMTFKKRRTNLTMTRRKRTSGSATTSESEVVRRGSSVSLGTVQEIQDKDADANWHDSERHSGRYTRIRGRIPTGHASLMKSSSDDMLDVLLAEDSEEGRRARELLLHNTELNSSSPPFSVRSWNSESAEPSGACDGAAKRSSEEAHSDADQTASKTDKKAAGSQSAARSGNALSILECHLNPSS